ncbi:fumarate reductase (quinol) flavoprotein subunit [Orbus mooreae]|uniref:fumarate reductase (quinol) flavoprotein subunit n=1 Tax=Orbus mooreae TaxID=3074107 RepID=UPI00370DA50F
MKIVDVDIAIIGGGGAGLSSAIEIAQHFPDLKIALISKVYPMRSHTVAAEGGAAGVIQENDSFGFHFYDTVSGGDWLCDQHVVELFVSQAPNALAKLERLGCPWARKKDGSVNVRRFGGMTVERTWFASDKTGFHILHTLFQSSLQFQQIYRFDEHYVLDLLVDDNRVTGLVALNMMEGKLVQFNAKSVIMATGGAGRVYQYNTNGSIVTGDGMAMAYRHGVALRDMEFVQYHPTGLPGSGILITEACRGEGGILTNKDGYRYLQDYGLGPETPLGEPKNRYMELGPRDRLSQAFWHENQKGNTLSSANGEIVYLDLRHLGQEKINQRLPFIRELARTYVGVDPVKSPIPVRPTAHYTMGGITTDINCSTILNGLYAVGECASVGLHGANRLGSNSLSEVIVFGEIAGRQAAQYAKQLAFSTRHNSNLASQIEKVLLSVVHHQGSENWAQIRKEMGQTMEQGCGIYRNEQGMLNTINKISELIERAENINIVDKSHVYNTELIAVLELKQSLLVAQAIVCSAILRKESRGAHQRLEVEYQNRNDDQFLKHSQASYRENELPNITFNDVNVSKLPPANRSYGGKEG